MDRQFLAACVTTQSTSKNLQASLLRALGSSVTNDDLDALNLGRVLRTALFSTVSTHFPDDNFRVIGFDPWRIHSDSFSSLSAALASDAASSILFEPASIFVGSFVEIGTDGDAALSADYSAISAGHIPAQIFDFPLWKDVYFDESSAHMGIIRRFKGYANEPPKLWSFWADWYQGFLDGTPVDWELQRRVALIPNDDWAMGPEHIALKIKEIQSACLAEKAPLAETVEINPATGNFRVLPIPVQNAPLIGTLLARVSDAVEDAVRGDNGLNQTSREVRVLERTVARYGNDPQRIEMDFTSVAVGLRRQINETQELPPSEDNLALLEAVEEGVRGLRATHPEVAANRAILAAQVWREIGAEDKARLAEALPLLEAISEGVLAEDFAVDIPALINDAILPPTTFAPRLPGAEVRVFNRVSKMALLWSKALNTGAALHDSRAHKIAKLGFTAASVSGVLYWVVKLGLWALGVL